MFNVSSSFGISAKKQNAHYTHCSIFNGHFAFRQQLQNFIFCTAAGGKCRVPVVKVKKKKKKPCAGS